MQTGTPLRFPWFMLLAATALHAQGGKEFIEWLRQYSPTGYFIINDYDTRANKPDDYKQWDLGTTSPLAAVAVHESGHMRNLDLNSKNGKLSYYIGDLHDFAFTPAFTPFSSAGILDDIPKELRNFQTEVYIQGGEGMYSVGSGLLGLAEEWNQYITGLKSGVEMSACYQANFNSTKNWEALTNDVTTSVWSNAEFRYFILRYIMLAKKQYPTVYSKIIADAGTRQLYTYLAGFAEKTMAEWIAVLTARKLDTKTENGFDWHWKYWNEIQKPEYKELEKIMLIAPVSIEPRAAGPRAAAWAQVAGLPTGLYDVQGRSIGARQPAFGVKLLSR